MSATAEIELSAALPDPEPSPETLRLLAIRRSTPAHALSVPGPTSEQTEALLRLGLRVPDHGKLAPWRLIVLGPDAKSAFLDRLLALPGRTESDLAAKKLAKLTAPPLTIVVVSRPVANSKIPVWEQELSAGAVCMNLLIAAEAMGFGANWITDWYAYDPGATGALGLNKGERVAGFIHVGTPAAPRQERPRPRFDDAVEWRR